MALQERENARRGIVGSREDHLQPVNPDFELIALTGADEAELQVVAELVEVPEPRAFSTETHSR